jgi:hypothetical protein
LTIINLKFLSIPLLSIFEMERRSAWRESHKSSKKSISKSPGQAITLPFHGFSRSKNTNSIKNIVGLAMRTEEYG